jgi:hypothetical protein
MSTSLANSTILDNVAGVEGQQDEGKYGSGQSTIHSICILDCAKTMGNRDGRSVLGSIV